jgi:glycosyltransferase involved in cell wall biosynthesis
LAKKRILVHSEFTSLSSGFAIYYKNVLERLNKTGKYEISEFANYASPDDPRIYEKDWKVYPVMPSREDKQYQDLYSKNGEAQFGTFKFEDACLDFKPNIVMSIFDHWYSSYISKSPYRRFFKFIWMPTVDSCPQRPNWIDTYSSCDKVLAYSYFGKETLEKESNGKINNVLVASPGVEDEFCPTESKEELRKMFGIPQDMKIVMMVARNQMRKLFPDFLETLSVFINKYKEKNKKLADNVYFYVHTSNPDRGWDLPQAILNSGYADRILTTYVCNKCKSVAISRLNKIVCECSKCKNKSMTMTSVNNGIKRKELGAIMKLADLGVLMSIGEGWGMPLSEFKKVGVPVIAVPYSATQEQGEEIAPDGRHRGGFIVPIERMATEADTMQKRAYFSRSGLAKKIYEVLTMPTGMYQSKCDEAKKCADEVFTWENTAKIWERAFDEIDISGLPGWNDSPCFMKEDIKVPAEIGNNYAEAAEWIINNITKHPYFTEFKTREIIESINSGVCLIDGYSRSAFGPNHLTALFKSFIEKYNFFEKKRVGYVKSVKNDTFGVI